MSDQRSSECEETKRDIPSFIEPRPPLILNPFMRPRPQKGKNLMEQFEEDSESEEPELVQVYLRLKPCNVRSNLYEVKSDRCLITSVDTAPMGHGRRTQHNVSKMYTFSHIFGPECDQKQIFEEVVKENLKKLSDGHNFTLLTYGASGSGKTYTLMGTVQAPGLVPRSLEYVFRVVDAAQQPLYKPVDGDTVKLDYYDHDGEIQFVRRLRQVSAHLRDKYRRMSVQLRNDLTTSTLDLSNRTRYYVWVSFVEIYNESIYDLLSHNDRSKATSKLRIREDANGQVFVKGATQAFVRSGAEAYDVMVAGKHNLQVAATGVHDNSSRSHCIFTITMITETDGGVRSSCVRLCDLAGCERQRRARNTGARMQESRAINSSLHVLERCLHMLRRKQRKIDATLVPYRESKLTRLLGAGLSGARGEAVSMVVTLNPAPEYTLETRHVLALAAVAKDIHVNQTIQESLFESTQDSTAVSVDPSGDALRLRAENERLHFELVQAQSRNKELLLAMEEKQQEVANTMFEIVEEAKDMTRQYYEAQMQALKTEMEEMQEEYESKLKAAADSETIHETRASPDRALANKVAALMTEIAILEEKLSAEKLARARAEEEVQHLRACIEERDEKAEQDSEHVHEEATSLTDDSESEDEEKYPFNESLEPTFNKEDLNRSKILIQSLLSNSKLDPVDSDQDKTINDDQNDNLETDDDDKNETLRYDESNDTVKDSTYLSEESNVTDKFGVTQDIVVKDIQNNTANESGNDMKSKMADASNINWNNTKCFAVRGTYVVLDDVKTKPIQDNTIVLSSLESIRQSFAELEVSFKKDLELSIEDTTNRIFSKNTIPAELSISSANVDQIETLSVSDELKPLENDVEPAISDKNDRIKDIAVSKIFSRQSTIDRSKQSLANFEQLEIAAKSYESKPKPIDPLQTFSKIKLPKEKRYFFDDAKRSNDPVPSNSKTLYFEDINTKLEVNKNLTEIKKLTNEERSPSIVKEDVENNVEPSTIQKLLGESFTRQSERISGITTISIPKKPASVDLFEGFDSPNIGKFKENISHSSEKINNKTEITERNTKSLFTTAETLVNTNSDVFIKPKDVFKPPAMKETHTKPKQNKSIFEECIEKKTSLVPKEESVVQDNCKSIKDIGMSQSELNNDCNNVKNNLEEPSVDTQNDVYKYNDYSLASQISYNNTADFDSVYKDVTPRDTEFEQLIAQYNSNINESKCEDGINKEKPKRNLRNTKMNRSTVKTEANILLEDKYKSVTNEIDGSNKKHMQTDKDDVKNYDTSVNKTNTTIEKQDTSLAQKENTSEEVLLESEAKCESKARPKRNLRLRRRKNGSDENTEKENMKLKDIVNLQKEFSDVTMDVPAPVKVVTDIESPEKKDEENVAPLGIQSCPSKSITRSRRKLFTPRAEPLEESMAQSGDSNERVRVPRPSYHRTRARRKL